MAEMISHKASSRFFLSHINVRWLVILLIALNGCHNVRMPETKSDDQVRQYEKVITLSTGVFKLKLKSILLKDTLIEEWEDDQLRFGTPLVHEQRLFFYKNEREIKSHLLPINRIKITTRKQQNTEVAALPVFDICIKHAGTDKLYYVYGAGFCNGTGCSEFTGLYNLDGDIIYEGVSTNESSARELEIVSKKYNLDFNKSDSCQTILDVWEK
jgi:hypothetical protein